MRKSLLNIALLLIAANLTACSSNPFQQTSSSTTSSSSREQTLAKNEAIEGQMVTDRSLSANLPRSMDENDKSKMLHALDKSPGKSTHWVNPTSGISYTVMPTQKVAINGNPYCRKYSITTNKDNNKNHFIGTACVGEDGNWNIVS